MKDDEEPILTTPATDLELLSIDDLEARIRSLENEIKACKVAIEQKRGTRSDADALFSFPTSEGAPSASNE